MKLLRFKFVHPKNGKQLEFTSIKFQYFYHYWSLITSKHNRIFLDNNKFESHRTLLNKIIPKLKSDPKHSKKKYEKYFVNHEHFRLNNVILKKLKINSLLQKTKTKNYNKELKAIIKDLEYYQSYITNRIDYTKHIYKGLQRVISINKKPIAGIYNEIEFLVNAYIVELYNAGYSYEFIAKIPDIITFNDVLNKFPFEKMAVDFNFDKEKYNKYKASHRKTLGLYISGLSNLINRQMLDGHVVFKVFNLNYKLDEPIEINSCRIYNPTTYSYTNERKQAKGIHVIEQFFDLKQDGETYLKHKSNCNIIVPIQLHYPLRNVEKRRQFLASLREAKRIINLFSYEYRIRGKENIDITDTHYYIIDKGSNVATYGLDIFHELRESEIETDADEEKYYRDFINHINRLNSNIDLHRKIRDIIDEQNLLKIDDQNFNFSRLWIAWEALLDKNQFKSFIKLCVNKRYDKQFLIDIILLLNSYLWDYMPGSKKNYFKLSNDKLKKYGIDISHNKALSAKKFRNNYKALFGEVNLPFLELIENKVEVFINDNRKFSEALISWIEETIEEFSNERNSEVHQNRLSDFSKLKLKTDVLFISEVTSKMIVYNMNQRNWKDLNKIKKRIKTSI
jgi:hypothetical protein